MKTYIKALGFYYSKGYKSFVFYGEDEIMEWTRKNIQIAIFVLVAIGLPPLGLLLESTQLTGFGFYVLDILILVMVLATHTEKED